MQTEVGRTNAPGGGEHERVARDPRALGLGAVGGPGLARRRHACDRGGYGASGVLQLFSGNRTAAGKILPALQVVTRTGKVRFTRLERGLELVGGGIQGPHVAHGLGEVGLRLRQRDLEIGLIKSNHRRSCPNQIRVVGLDPDHGAGDLGCQCHDVAGDIGIVGRLFVLCGVFPPVAIDGATEHNYRKQH